MSCFNFYGKTSFGLEEINKVANENQLLTLDIEFNRNCNFNCPDCYLEDTNGLKELGVEESRDVILQAKVLGAKKIAVLGGEPMIYPKIMEQIRFICSQGLEVELFTNGTNITESRARELADLNVKIVLKMNTFDRDKQNKFCGRDDAYEIIQNAFGYLKAAGYGKGGKAMAVCSLINEENIDELETLWCLLREQGIEPYLKMMTPHGRVNQNNWLYSNIECIEKLFIRLAEIDKSRFNYTWNPQPPFAGNSCLRHKYSLYVNVYGDVLPCVGITIVVGNIRRESLSEIIKNSEVIQDLRHHQEHIKSFCASCDKSEFCYGCRGAAYQLTGDYMESDPLCWRFQDRKNEILNLPVAVDSFIPHCKPMQFVDTLVSIGERSAMAETEIKADCPMLDERGILYESAFIEIIAQSCAAHGGFRARHKKNMPQGYLLGAKNVRILNQVRVGEHLKIMIHKEAKLGDFGIISGRIYRDDECVAEGEIKVYETATEVSE